MNLAKSVFGVGAPEGYSSKRVHGKLIIGILSLIIEIPNPATQATFIDRGDPLLLTAVKIQQSFDCLSVKDVLILRITYLLSFRL